MFCIVVYDIATENPEDDLRLIEVFETCRKYLDHVELSVFYGNISKRKLIELIKDLKKIIDKERDSVIIYVFKSKESVKSIIKYGILERENIL